MLNKVASQTELEYWQHIVNNKNLSASELEKANKIATMTYMTRLALIGRLALYQSKIDKISNLHK